MINIYNSNRYSNVINSVIKGVLKHFGINEKEIEIELELVSEDEIKELNREERNVDAVTDVLSFPALEVKMPFNKADYPDDVNPENGAVILGEIYVCRKRAEEQAIDFNHSALREVGFLTAHGMLHLLGYDHENEEERAEMEKLQDEILTDIGVTRDLADDALIENEDMDKPVKVGYIAILGHPNAGKSTLINTLVGEKVSIVSWKPQTTRNRILGIRNDEDSQIIFVDTPGLHAPKNALGKFMMRSVTAALEGVEAICYLIDGEKGIIADDLDNVKRYIETDKPVIVAINKIDHITRERVAEILTELSNLKDVLAVVPLSALKDRNTDALISEIKKVLKEGTREYDEELYTDRNMRFMTAEIIREKALRILDKEVPYGIGVQVNKYEYNARGILEIDADVICQKAAHKPIILGKNGDTIKRIATYAREDLETMTGSKIFITLWVRVKPDWRDDANILSELGYDKNNY